MIKYLLAYALAGACLYAQAQDSIKPLTIGDTVPKSFYTYINGSGIGSSNQELPVLIEFFATYCTACIALLPKLDALQKQHNAKVIIVPVTDEPKEKVAQLFQQQPSLRSVTLNPIGTATLLKQYFPHQSVPHLVWINQKGKIAAITNADQATAENIQKLVSGNPLQLPFKDDAFEYNPAHSLISQIPGNEALYFQSTVARFIPNAKSNVYGTTELKNGGTKKYFINMSLVNILQIALGRIHLNRFIIQAKDSFNLASNRSGGTNGIPDLYSYEIILPRNYNENEYLHQLISDLGNAARLKIRIEKTPVECYVLKKLPVNTRLQNKNGNPVFSLPKPENPRLIMANQPLRRLINAINAGGGYKAPLIIDETGITDPVDLTLKTTTINDLPAIKKGLADYGFTLIKARRKVDMVVISDTLPATTLNIKTSAL